MTAPVRGGIYPYHNIRRGVFLVVSMDFLNRAGYPIVVEVTTQAPPEDQRSLLAVPLTEADPLPGGWVLCWRVNYAHADRLDVAGSPGRASTGTMDRVINAVRAAIEP